MTSDDHITLDKLLAAADHLKQAGVPQLPDDAVFNFADCTWTWHGETLILEEPKPNQAFGYKRVVITEHNPNV